MKKILLDTNAYSNYFRGNDAILLALSQADIVYLSIFVISELLTGFKGGSKEKWNKELLHQFINKPTVEILNGTYETADIFAHIKNNLKKKGNPIPINDVWIASHVIETNSILITYDEHFKLIPGLRIWNNL